MSHSQTSITKTGRGRNALLAWCRCRGWLDVSVTYRVTYNELSTLLESDPSFSNYRMASYDEYNDMLNKVIPSVFTATSFYQGRPSRPEVAPNEGKQFRTLFGNSNQQVIFGRVSDGITEKWMASNSWGGGRVSYSDIYSEPNGRALRPDATDIVDYGTKDTGWFLVANGEGDMDSAYFRASPANVNVPAVGIGMAGLLMVSWRRRKMHS